MNATSISSLFNELGVSPGYKGYPYLIHTTGLAITYYGKPFPCMKILYQQTAEHFNISENKVKDDIRTLLRNYWNQKNASGFSDIIGYPVRDSLTPKKFVAIVAEYLALHSESDESEG